MIIILAGMPGCGKTTIASEISTILGYKFVDLDQYMEVYRGLVVEDIFSTFGEKHFRELESECLHNILKNELSDVVISLGGGTLVSAQNQELCQKYTSVWLNTNLNIIYERIKNSKHRPLLKNNIAQSLEQLLLQREDSYKMCLYEYKVVDENLSVENIAQDIVKMVMR